MTKQPDSPARSPRSGVWRLASRLVMMFCILTGLAIAYGSYLQYSDLRDVPLRLGEPVSVKSGGKGWSPGFVRHIAEDGEIHVAMGATRPVAERPQTDVVKVRGTGSIRRRKSEGE